LFFFGILFPGPRSLFLLFLTPGLLLCGTIYCRPGWSKVLVPLLFLLCGFTTFSHPPPFSRRVRQFPPGMLSPPPKRIVQTYGGLSVRRQLPPIKGYLFLIRFPLLIVYPPERQELYLPFVRFVTTRSCFTLLRRKMIQVVRDLISFFRCLVTKSAFPPPLSCCSRGVLQAFCGPSRGPRAKQ